MFQRFTTHVGESTTRGLAIASVPWSVLTRIPLKEQLYGRETYFREGLDDVEWVFGDALGEALWQSAMLMIKPDGLVAGKLAPVLGFLRDHDFTPVGVRALRLHRTLWRELWRYQLTSATLDRLAVNEAVLETGPALMLALHSAENHDLPASVRLSSLKGSAMMAVQVPGTLRHLLGQPNRVLSLIHVADEPADLVREFGLLFHHPARLRLLERLRDGQPGRTDEEALAQALCQHPAPGRSLISAESVERVSDAVRSAQPGNPDVVAHLLADLDRMRAGQRIEWRPFRRRLDGLAVSLDPWDIAVLGTSFITYDEPGTVKVLVNPDPESWRHGRELTGGRAEWVGGRQS